MAEHRVPAPWALLRPGVLGCIASTDGRHCFLCGMKQSKEIQDKIKKLESNDLEYLDQLARDKHDLSDPDEIIIFNNKEKKKE